jgi:post-segregation antitoxin (ccd killing protein)
MSAVKKTISIDAEVAKHAADMGPNFSAIVETALIEYIQHHRVKKAIDSFGKWGARKENSAEIVKNLRTQDDREAVSRHDNDKFKG